MGGLWAPNFENPGTAYSGNCRSHSTRVTAYEKIDVLSGPPSLGIHTVQGATVAPGASKYDPGNPSYVSGITQVSDSKLVLKCVL